MLGAASEIARLRAALTASEARSEVAESELAQARAVVSTSEAMIKHLKLEIAKLRREQYGRNSVRRARLIDQMELQLDDIEAAATEDELAAETAAKITSVGRCCKSLTTEDSLCESMRLDAPHEQAITRPLPHDELVQLQRVAQAAGVSADLGRQEHDLARAA